MPAVCSKDIQAKTISEFKIIEKYLSNIGTSYNNKNKVLRGIGDDAAVISLSKNLIVSTDTSVEGVHFLKGIQPEYAAYRACVTALSDLAAMGSQPLACLLYTSPSPRDRTRSRMPSSA